MEPQNSIVHHEFDLSSHEREKGWYLSGDTWLYKYHGFWFTETVLRSILSLSQLSNFSLSSSNILLSTSPKCGTTWIKALSFAIVTRSQYKCPLDSPLQSANPHSLMPYLETPEFIQNPNVPVFSTHMPFTCLPKSISESDCKIVYVCRDPKDNFVSRWHYTTKVGLLQNDHDAQLFPLDHALDLFCRGLSNFGPFWDHALEYWKASLEHPDKVLFLKYEDMMKDPTSHVISLAKFMGFSFSSEEQMEGVPLKIAEMCSFESLSNLEVNKGEKTSTTFGTKFNNALLFRNGKVGDWKNYLTQEMAHKIDQITEMKLGSYGLHL